MFKNENESNNTSSTVFHRLNKLANTKLKDYVGGQQLIDLRGDPSMGNIFIKRREANGKLKTLILNSEEEDKILNEKLKRILENKAKKAIDIVKKKNTKVTNTFDETEFSDNRKSNNISKKIITDIEIKPHKINAQRSLQINQLIEKNLVEKIEKHENPILKNVSSFEVQYPKQSNIISKPPTFELNENEIQTDFEKAYDIGKIPSNKFLNENETNEINEIVNRSSKKKKKSSLKTMESIPEKNDEHDDRNDSNLSNFTKISEFKTLNREDYSYNEFETSSIGDNKRKITMQSEKYEKKSGKIKLFFLALKEYLSIVNLKKNFEDSFVDVLITGEKSREINTLLSNTRRIVLPGSFIRSFFDLITFIFCFYYLISTASIIAFETGERSPGAIFFESLVAFVFLMDIFLNFRTGYINSRGVLELYPSKIMTKYLKTYFFFDLLSTIPMFHLTSDPYIKLFYLIRLLKAIRIYKIMKRIYEITNYHPGIIRIIKSFIFLIILWHNFGCFYWYITSEENFTNPGWAPPSQIYAMDDSGAQYAYSLFFAITVTTGIGIQLSPVTLTEIIFTLFSIIIGVFMYGLLLGSATSALMSLDEEDSEIRKQLDSLSSFMRKKKVSLDLQKRIQENLKYLWSSNQSLNISNQWFLEGVHPLLKLELTLQINTKYLEKVPLFKNIGFESMIHLIGVLETRIFLPDEFIVYQNQISEEMYFIQSGMLEVLDSNRGIKIRLFEGDFFGEQAIIQKNSRRTTSIKSIVYSELLILSKKNLEIIVEENKNFGIRLFMYLKKKMLVNFKNKKEKKSRWVFVYMILKAALNIKRMNEDLTIEHLFFPKKANYNPKTPITRTIIKNLDNIEENEIKESEIYEEEKSNDKTKAGKHKKFIENVYQTTSQLSELVRNVMKDKKDIPLYEKRQTEILDDKIEAKDKKKDEFVSHKSISPYENYDIGSNDKKSHFKEKPKKSEN